MHASVASEAISLSSDTVKDILRRWVGRLPLPAVQIERSRRTRFDWYKLYYLTARLLDASGNMVYGGPFNSMNLATNLHLCQDPRIIVGSYEEELHSAVNEVICAAPESVINIGS